MILRRLIQFATAVCLASPMSVSAELNAGHRVDPDIDIVVGSETAPHEMIVYFSPGCPGCIVLQEFLADFYERGVTENRLRVVYRLVPAFHHRGANRQLAEERSEWMGRWLQCRFTTGGADGFSSAMDVFIRYAMASNRRFEGGEITWPAIPNGRFASFRTLLRERGVYADPDQPACDRERALDFFARNVVLLDRTAGEVRDRVRAPMIIIDGEWYNDTLALGMMRVFAALQFRVFNMDGPEESQ